MNDSPSFAAYLESPYRSLKHSSYFRVYDTLFGPYRGKAITFVEVGILGGGSLFMWRSFFGPQARIIGVDLNPNARKWEKDGFEIFIGSQSDTAFWQDFARKVGPVDILLDDGGHIGFRRYGRRNRVLLRDPLTGPCHERTGQHGPLSDRTGLPGKPSVQCA